MRLGCTHHQRISISRVSPPQAICLNQQTIDTATKFNELQNCNILLSVDTHTRPNIGYRCTLNNALDVVIVTNFMVDPDCVIEILKLSKSALFSIINKRLCQFSAMNE